MPDILPGIYPDMDEAEYHADPVSGWSLSASGAALLLDPSCPALYLHSRENPKPRTKALDMGVLAHRVVLGAGWMRDGLRRRGLGRALALGGGLLLLTDGVAEALLVARRVLRARRDGRGGGDGR